MEDEYLIPETLNFESDPYVRPRTYSRRRVGRGAGFLVAVVLMLLGAIALYRCMPGSVKAPLHAWLFGGNSDDGTQNGTTTAVSTTPAPEETTVDIYQWKCDLPQGATAILPVDRCANTLGIFMKNPTDAVPESVVAEFVRAETGKISVLILNTHSYEAYSEEGALYFDDPSYASDTGENRNVGAVCRLLADALNENGIGAVFVDCMAESGLGSYRNAMRMAELSLEEYPDVRLVIDVHRGVLRDATGAVLRPITARFGETLAQMKLIVGADASFEQNIAAALALFAKASLVNGEWLMPTEIQNGALLQTLSIPVVTVEIGTCGNYVSEAQRSAALLAEVIAELMLTQESG